MVTGKHSLDVLYVGLQKTLITGNARIPTTLTLSWFTQSLKENGGILPQTIYVCFFSEFNSFFTSHSIFDAIFRDTDIIK
jgi:hypothetical protein